MVSRAGVSGLRRRASGLDRDQRPARLFTWVTVHRAFLPGYRVPYVTALVELVEDTRVRLATYLRDVPAGGLRTGMRVEVVFESVTEQLTLPVFRCVR